MGILAMPFLLSLAGCQDLTEINQNPNALTDDKTNPAYVLTSVITGTASELADISFSGNVTQCVAPAAMQYVQRDFLEFNTTNQFAWIPLNFDYRGLYLPMSNASYLEKRASGNVDSLFIKGTSKTMQALWFGVQSSSWGDVPYSQAFKGTDNLQPAFDKQIDVFKGILKDLEDANSYLAKTTVVNSSVMIAADVLYTGKLLKWRQFANSLHLRYLMRLSGKAAEMKAAGVDIASEFNKIVSDPATYPLITSSADDASIKFPGTNTTDSYTLGPLVTTTISEFYRIKAAATIVDYLKVRNDPRLTVWFKPVDVQTLVRDKGADVVIATDAAGKVKRYIKSYQTGIDTSLYVGLKIALTDPDSYNNNVAAQRTQAAALSSSVYNSGAANPFVSYLGTIFRTNTDPLIKSVFISASEVNFILAEASSRGWIKGAAPDYLVAAVSASMDQYSIANGDVKVYNPSTHAIIAFNKTEYLDKLKTEFNAAANPLEVIMQQKWVSSFATMESWFDYRRTGFPNIAGNILNGSQGTKIPSRLMYGENETNYNPKNTSDAISRLVPATNDQWSKMWLLQ
ncbi:SusD/RagB family nutrient-binding outer membrane lipoprotein [Dyadobacter frigoris]|uniref:SusD/RagB family nutrient-binding outer membrane lipoprotein n=1 Tax=Dyadobacter frigoris TaxID=2576211 RepID=UPI00148575E2|nr:SusD/RagB family nutrient-binding outer membrane lipoprotein [Dyadobacter frigoris]